MVVVWIVASVIFVVFVTARYASVLERPCVRPFPEPSRAAATLTPPRLNRRGAFSRGSHRPFAPRLN
jgi:hypothetical protein